jgi:hypothetical protein
MANKKREMVDEHLMHIVKNTTPLQRMIWLKKSVAFWKKKEIQRQSKRAGSVL